MGVCPDSLIKTKIPECDSFLLWKRKNSQVDQKERGGGKGTIWDHLGSIAAFILGGILGRVGHCGERSVFRAGAGSHGYSCPVNCDCDVACMHPDRDPGSPGRRPAALGYAGSQRTCGCVPYVPARCGSFHLMSSGCDVHLGSSGLLCGYSVAFFGSANHTNIPRT